MADAIEAMRDAFTQMALGNVVLPPRTRLDIPESNGLVLLMPCRAGTSQMSLKVIQQFAGNRARGLPLIQALVLLGDASDGRFLAIMDGAALTAIRTGAVSGLATQLLARKDSRTAAIFGAGVQARTQLEAVCAARPIRAARVYDEDYSQATRFAKEMSERLGIAVTPADNSAEALKDADVICTATTSRTPVFLDNELAPGAHVNGVGSWKPETVEIPEATICRARVFVDQRAAAMEEAGDLLMPLQKGKIHGEHFQELGELLTERVPGRQGPEEITVFKSVGLAVQDLFAAGRAWQNARRLGIGMELPR